MKNLFVTIFSILALIGCDTRQDKIYHSFKCAKAATYLEDHANARIALEKAELYFNDIHTNEAYFWMQLNQRFQEDFKLYTHTHSGQMEILSTLYNSRECKMSYEQTATSGTKSYNQPVKKNTRHSLEDIFQNFNTCDFPKVSYNLFSEVTSHPYFSEAKVRPYKIEQSLAFYSVNDSLFGMPVSHIILPVTWTHYSVTFDLPINEVRLRLETVFGEGFEAVDVSDAGYKPFLIARRDAPSKTVIYCDEPEYDE